MDKLKVAKVVSDLWESAQLSEDQITADALIQVGSRIADALERLCEVAEEVPEAVQPPRNTGDRTFGFRMRVANFHRGHPEYSMADCIQRVQAEMRDEQRAVEDSFWRAPSRIPEIPF